MPFYSWFRLLPVGGLLSIQSISRYTYADGSQVSNSLQYQTMNKLEDQSTLSDFPAFQPLVARFAQHHRVMDFRTLPLEALLSTLTFQQDDTLHRDTQRKDQEIEYPCNHTTTDSEESEWGTERRKGLEKKKYISKKNEQNRKLKTK